MVSVVVPCYNCEETLSRCIQSIRIQTRAEIEIVLVDDGSIDKTGEMCDRAAKEDRRIRVFHQENKGLMNAWKRGVLEATGEFIAFCDADDYMDDNMIEVLENKAIHYQADIVISGKADEYSNGTILYIDNRLAEGFYKKKDIQSKILPVYFSNGQMQSNIILAGRWVKLFRKSLLVENFSYLDDSISLGEDDLTTFSTVLSAESIYCIQNFYPYHYVKHQDSMIGRYDKNMFQKFLDLRNQMYLVAQARNYSNLDQIDAEFLSNTLLCMKKEISRNKNGNYSCVKQRLSAMRENIIFNAIINKCDISKYEVKSKIFAYLIIKKRYLAVYILTKFGDSLGIGKA